MSTQVLEAAPTSAPEVTATAGWRRYLRSGWFWAAVAATALLLCWADVPYLRSIVGRDEGAFLVMAQGLLHGHVPYRDAFDQKPPGIYFLLAPVLALTSPFSLTVQVLAIRLLVLAANVATAAGLVAIGARWRRAEAGVFAAGLWLFTLSFFDGIAALTEPFAVVCTVWAFVLAGRRASFRTALWTGLLIGLGALFKQTVVLAIPGIALVLLAQAWRSARDGQGQGQPRRWRAVWSAVAGLTAGGVAPWAVTGAYFALTGALGPFFQDVVVANVHYPADPFSITKTMLKVHFYTLPLIMLVPACFVVVGVGAWLFSWLRGRRPPVAVWLVAVALLAALNLAPFVSHAYYHYWLQVFPWTSLLTGAAVMAVIQRAWPMAYAAGGSRAFDAPLRAALLPLTVVLVLAFGPANFSRLSVTDSFHMEMGAGQWIREHVPANARLLVGQAEPEYYFASGHLPVTDYLYVLPVNESPALLAEVHGQIDAHAFDYILWQRGYAAAPDDLGLWPYITQRYHVIASEDVEDLVLLAPNP